jgi:hypothetical protein
MATFEDIKNIIISDDPVTGLQRKVDVDSFYCGLDPNNGFFRLDCTVYRFKSGENVNSETLPVYKRTLTADNTDMVNQYGEIVPADDPTAIMGQYSFFQLAAGNPLELYNIFLSKVMAADLIGKFN